MASFLAKYRKWNIPSKASVLGLIASLVGLIGLPLTIISFFKSDPVQGIFKSQVRPNIHLTKVQIDDLNGSGQTVMGIFTNNRDSDTHDFKWAVFGSDGKTPIPFDNPAFANLIPSLGPYETEKLPLFAAKDFAKFVPTQYANMKFRDAYVLPPPMGERPNGVYVPILTTFSCRSDAGEQIGGNVLLYVRLTDH